MGRWMGVSLLAKLAELMMLVLMYEGVGELGWVWLVVLLLWWLAMGVLVALIVSGVSG